MLPTRHLPEFLLTIYVLILIPGPSVLSAIRAVIALLADGAWAIASGSARQWLGRSPRRLEGMTSAGGAMLIALGVGLAVTTRRS